VFSSNPSAAVLSLARANSPVGNAAVGAKNTNEMTKEREKGKARVFLVDDHALVREHLTALLELEPDLEVCGQAADGRSALTLMRGQDLDLVILDLSMKGPGGLELLRNLKELRPKLPVLVLSMHDESFYVERALGAGAMGYITKEEAPIHIVAAVRKVLGGQTYLSERIAGRLTSGNEPKERSGL
jgi:DNA-binding NarL/FixJ family response regulator